MLKKVVLGAVIVGLVGVLIFGAVNRTLARWEYDDGGQGGQRHGQAGGYSQSGMPFGDGSRGGRGEGRGGESGGQGYGGGGGRGQGAGAALDGPAGAGQPALAADWLTVSGTVTGVDADRLVIDVTDGRVIEVANRAWWFARSQGFAAATGDAVTVEGFYDGDQFEAARIINATSGAMVTVRDDSGRPLWAGRGNW